MMPRNKELGEPSTEELIEALQHVNEALHRLGGAWQQLSGNVRARLVSESQRIEELLDRAGALPMPLPLTSRDRRFRHLPPPKPASHQTKTMVLGGYRKASKPRAVAASDNPLTRK